MQSACLNPCCNGRCTRTYLCSTINISLPVLILVVMEDALAHLVSQLSIMDRLVLILVVMEDALALVLDLISKIVGLS